MIRGLLVLLPLLLLALLFPADARAVCLANCPPVWADACGQLTGVYACQSGEYCWLSSDRCCAACQPVVTPPPCQTSDQGCGANGCPANTKRICQDCGTGWTCSCNPDSACGGGPPPPPTPTPTGGGSSGGGCVPNCSDSGGHCSGTSYTGNCGQTCTGTKCDTPGRPTLVAPTGGVEMGSPVTFSWNAGVGGFGACSGGGGSYQACLVSGLCATSLTTSKTVSIPPIPVGNQGWNVKATNSCGNTGQTSATRQFCAEGFDPANANYVSTWSAYGLCDGLTHARTRTRTCREDCGVDDCAAYPLTETQTCYGQMTGIFFDASSYSSCPANPGLLPADLKISGGTISLSGTPNYGPYTTDATGRYTTAATLLSPGTYLLLVNPGSSTFVTTPKFSCDGTALTLLGSDPTCLTQPCETAPATTHNFGFWKVYGGWWQVTGGSVFGGAGITSNIPSTIPASEQRLIRQDANLQDGLAQIGTGTISLGTNPGASISVSGWNATSSYPGDKANYDYFMAKTGSYPRTAWNGTSKPAYTPTNGFQTYTYTGNPTINWSPVEGEKVIYMIKGDVTVSGDIVVPTSSPSFLAVIASGSITFDTNVTNVDGWWVGNSLNFPCVDTTPLDGTCDKTDVQFVGNGSFVGWNSISLSRDQGGANNTIPAEKFTFRPDLLINAPESVVVSRYV
ncbi:hypothetical protein HYU91_03390 [Candidatus Collierbacteria bacterium]|nr:hypothetical protein [Candidatus Collierbacteria bacterium]